MKRLTLCLGVLLSIPNLAHSVGDKHCYVKVTQTWYNQNRGYTKGPNTLEGARDTSGNYFISISSYNEFPELFDNRTNVTLYWLYPNAFPADSSIK